MKTPQNRYLLTYLLHLITPPANASLLMPPTRCVAPLTRSDPVCLASRQAGIEGVPMSKTGTSMQVDRELTKRLVRSFAPPVALPEQLRNDLVSAYSARLYGAPGRVSLDTLRIIWPALLGSAARSALHGAVLCSIPVHSLLRNESSLLARTQRRFAHHTYPFLPMRNFFINTNAILVHQPARSEHQPDNAARAHDISSSCKATPI